MTPDHDEHERERGHTGHGDGDSTLDGAPQPGIDWSRVVAVIVALIVLAIAAILLSTGR